MKTKLVYLSMIISVILSACKGDDGPEGPQGPAGSAFNLAQGGFIQGTVSGIRSDGTPFTLDFNNKYYYSADNYRYDQFGPTYYFTIERYTSGNPQAQGSCYLDFEMYQLNSTTPSYVNFDGVFFKGLGNNQTFVFEMNTVSGPNIIITNFSYNITTHIAQGNFAITVDAFSNSTGYSATISGSFQSAAMTEYVYRRGN